MTKQMTFGDVANLSAFLDEELPKGLRTRMEKRIQSEPEMASVYEDLRQARTLIRKMPRRRAPRNFTLTPKMAGIKPPVPRLVPAFSWASAAAVLLFVFTLGSTMLGKLSFGFGAAAPMAAAPAGYGIGGGPDEEVMATEAAVEESLQDNGISMTATPETMLMTAPEPTMAAEERAIPPEAEVEQTKVREPVNPWLVTWLAAAVVLVGAAGTVRWLSIRAFRRKSK